ncbi:MAG: hypothetical protein GY827_00100 [Cytophagales bacterium]|nr:hypothetical protein [Cytophagales bacterium]
MEWLTVLAFILLGILLIAAEIIFIPGTTIVGFIGFGTGVIGIYYGYSTYGSEIGHMILGGTTVITSLVAYLCFKLEVWSTFALNKNIDESVTSNVNTTLVVGAEGTTTSALRPMGTAEFEGELFEVKTHGNFVDTGKSVRIIKIDNESIIVESF